MYISHVDLLHCMHHCPVVVEESREPKLERPYRVWPTTPIIFLVACMLLMITTAYAEWKEVGCSFLVVLLGIPVYWLLYRNK